MHKPEMYLKLIMGFIKALDEVDSAEDLAALTGMPIEQATGIINTRNQVKEKYFGTEVRTHTE